MYDKRGLLTTDANIKREYKWEDKLISVMKIKGKLVILSAARLSLWIEFQFGMLCHVNSSLNAVYKARMDKQKSNKHDAITKTWRFK
jgi:hypothetical protein